MLRMNVCDSETIRSEKIKPREASVQNGDSSPMGNQRRVEPQRRIRIRIGQVEFPATIEADPVGAALDREHTAHVFMPAAKNKLEDSEQPVHKS
jgi:hypothetical protein